MVQGPYVLGVAAKATLVYEEGERAGSYEAPVRDVKHEGFPKGTSSSCKGSTFHCYTSKIVIYSENGYRHHFTTARRTASKRSANRGAVRAHRLARLFGSG